MNNQLNPTQDERHQLIEASVPLFRSRFYNPHLNGVDLDAEVEKRLPELLSTTDFPAAMKALFATTKAHPIDFFHETDRRVLAARALKSTVYIASNGDVRFQDVLVGGRAAEAGIRPNDQLVSINGVEAGAEALDAPAHQPLTVVYEESSGRRNTLSLPPPATWKPRKEKNVTFRSLGSDAGYVRIARWPGILGIDISKETDEAIKALKAQRLVVDLRGNLGSEGAGNLRLMSYLTPEKIPVGYSLTRRRAENGYDRNELVRLERVPKFKAQAPFILWKYRKVDKSIVVVTEGLRKQRFHGAVSILVNRHTVSGAEIVVQFAKEHSLAKIIGERTAGRSLSYATLKLPLDFRLVLPIGDYVPWHGERFEGTGIEPDISVHFESAPNMQQDHQLEQALSARA